MSGADDHVGAPLMGDALAKAKVQAQMDKAIANYDREMQWIAKRAEVIRQNLDARAARWASEEVERKQRAQPPVEPAPPDLHLQRIDRALARNGQARFCLWVALVCSVVSLLWSVASLWGAP